MAPKVPQKPPGYLSEFFAFTKRRKSEAKGVVKSCDIVSDLVEDTWAEFAAAAQRKSEKKAERKKSEGPRDCSKAFGKSLEKIMLYAQHTATNADSIKIQKLLTIWAADLQPNVLALLTFMSRVAEAQARVDSQVALDGDDAQPAKKPRKRKATEAPPKEDDEGDEKEELEAPDAVEKEDADADGTESEPDEAQDVPTTTEAKTMAQPVEPTKTEVIISKDAAVTVSVAPSTTTVDQIMKI